MPCTILPGSDAPVRRFRQLTPEVVMTRDRFSLWLDVALLPTVCALEVTILTGLPVHEWLGVALTVGLLVHLLLQWPWIASRTRRLAQPGSARTRINYLINLSLFVSMVATLYSGFMISRNVLPALGLDASHDRRWGRLHGFSSSAILILVGLHLALNWSWVKIFVSRLVGSRGPGQGSESPTDPEGTL
jgi:cytochrome b561